MRRFLELVTADEAAAHLAAFTASRTETIDARRALGRVAAGDVHAREDIPHFFRSNMDGYAVRSEDTGAASPSSAVALEIVGTVAMGEIPRFRIEPGTAARISTGGMMPEGADAVVLVERTEELPRERVAIRESVAPRDSTIAIGEDAPVGGEQATRDARRRTQVDTHGDLLSVLSRTEQVLAMVVGPLLGVFEHEQDRLAERHVEAPLLRRERLRGARRAVVGGAESGIRAPLEDDVTREELACMR